VQIENEHPSEWGRGAGGTFLALFLSDFLFAFFNMQWTTREDKGVDLSEEGIGRKECQIERK
jgi:hypothetical protein